MKRIAAVFAVLALSVVALAAPVHRTTLSSTNPTQSTATALSAGWHVISCDTAAYLNFGTSSVTVTSSAFGLFAEARTNYRVQVTRDRPYVRSLAVAGTSVCQLAPDA